jgi:hypothetical protein
VLTYPIVIVLIIIKVIIAVTNLIQDLGLEAIAVIVVQVEFMDL